MLNYFPLASALVNSVRERGGLNFTRDDGGKKEKGGKIVGGLLYMVHYSILS